jgi:hypothetical protein
MQYHFYGVAKAARVCDKYVDENILTIQWYDDINRFVCVNENGRNKLNMFFFLKILIVFVAPLCVATPLNVALSAKCRTIAAKCRNRR